MGGRGAAACLLGERRELRRLAPQLRFQRLLLLGRVRLHPPGPNDCAGAAAARPMPAGPVPVQMWQG